MTASPVRLRTLRIDIRQAGAWITMTRPECRNALDLDLIADLGTALDLAGTDQEARAVVITGTDDAFCAGADLPFVQSLRGPRDIVKRFLEPLTVLLRRIRELPKPVIAAVNGHCVAGGVELILCCDLIVAAENAQIADGHSRFGLLPAIGGAHSLARSLGPHKAKELLFSGDTVTGRQLAELRLLNYAVPTAELNDTVAALVAKLASRSPSGLARMKQMVNEGTDMPWDLAARHDLLLAESHLASGAPAEGLAAFAEKRAPHFGPDQ